MDEDKQNLIPPHYEHFLQELKDRIRAAQVRAALSVNRELVLLYWSIGRDILVQQDKEGWGTKVIDRLSQDLTTAFPDVHGFRGRNLKYMRAFAEAYPDKEFVQQVVAQLPWGHQVRILDTVKDYRIFVNNKLKDIRQPLSNTGFADPTAIRAELRKHVSEIRLTPHDGQPRGHYVAEGAWDLVGKEEGPAHNSAPVSIRMVAGGGFEPPTFGL